MEEAFQQGITVPAAVQVAVIISNLFVRLAGIAAGVYIAKLGHDTIVREARGEVEFNYDKLGLKANIPGPIFVLLGVAAIGWALASPVTGKTQIELHSEEASLPFERPTDEN